MLGGKGDSLRSARDAAQVFTDGVPTPAEVRFSMMRRTERGDVLWRVRAVLTKWYYVMRLQERLARRGLKSALPAVLAEPICAAKRRPAHLSASNVSGAGDAPCLVRMLLRSLNVELVDRRHCRDAALESEVARRSVVGCDAPRYGIEHALAHLRRLGFAKLTSAAVTNDETHRQSVPCRQLNRAVEPLCAPTPHGVCVSRTLGVMLRRSAHVGTQHEDAFNVFDLIEPDVEHDHSPRLDERPLVAVPGVRG